MCVSSSAIVRVCAAFAPRVAEVGLLRVTMTVSADSIARSLRMEFGSSFAVSPAAKVSVPLASVKSAPPAAVPPVTAKLTATAPACAALRATTSGAVPADSNALEAVVEKPTVGVGAVSLSVIV